jgi:hypothetical protein
LLCCALHYTNSSVRTGLQVESVNVFQQRVNQFWEAYQEDLQKQVPGVTLDDFKWARALVSMKQYAFELPAQTIFCA